MEGGRKGIINEHPIYSVMLCVILFIRDAMRDPIHSVMLCVVLFTACCYA